MKVNDLQSLENPASLPGRAPTPGPRILSAAQAKTLADKGPGEEEKPHSRSFWGFGPSRAGGTGFRPSLSDLVMKARPKPGRSLMTLFLVLLAGTTLGIGSAAFVVQSERPLATQSLGPWTTNPTAGTAEADPYSKAIYTRSARVPLAQGEGLALTAYTDSSRRPLSPDCDYQIEGSTPTARLWTLMAATARGALVSTVAGRASMNSTDILRKPDGSFVINASAQPASGNWLPLADKPEPLDGLSFTMRLYDAPVTTGSSLEGASMPSIRRLACR